MLNLFIGAWLSISSLPGQSDTSSVVLVEWYKDMNLTTAYDLSLYSITDSSRYYAVYDIFKVDSIIATDGFIEKPKNTFLFALVTEKLPYKKFLYCAVKGYGVDYFYHYGFSPNIFDSTNVSFFKK